MDRPIHELLQLVYDRLDYFFGVFELKGICEVVSKMYLDGELIFEDFHKSSLYLDVNLPDTIGGYSWQPGVRNVRKQWLLEQISKLK